MANFKNQIKATVRLATYFEWCEILSISEAIVAIIAIAAISIVSVIVEIFATTAASIADNRTAESLGREIVWIHFVGAIARSIKAIVSKVIVLFEIVVATIFVRMKWTMLLWWSSAIISIARIL